MAAFTNDTGYDLSVFIYVTEADLGFSSQSLSEEELERVAKALSDAYYSGNDNVRSLTPEKPYEIEQIGKLTYISLAIIQLPIQILLKYTITFLKTIIKSRYFSVSMKLIMK